MATPTHTPHGRGYDSSLNYFGHGNWAWTQAEWGGSLDHVAAVPQPTVVDLWDTDAPAAALNGTMHEEYLFRDRWLSILADHDGGSAAGVSLFMAGNQNNVGWEPFQIQHATLAAYCVAVPKAAAFAPYASCNTRAAGEAPRCACKNYADRQISHCNASSVRLGVRAQSAVL